MRSSEEAAEDGGFTSEISSLALCWVNMVLQLSSFLFEVHSPVVLRIFESRQVQSVVDNARCLKCGY